MESLRPSVHFSCNSFSYHMVALYHIGISGKLACCYDLPKTKMESLRRSVHKILKIFKNSNFTAVHLPDTRWRYTRLPYQAHRKVYIHCRHTHVRLHYFKTLQTQMVANFLFKNRSNYLTSCWAWPWHWMTFFVRLSEIHIEKKF